MRFARILLVEDYEPFRRVVRDRLRSRPEFQIVGEASDGLDAIRLAQQLQPDLVLLDIGLPTLNGIQVARRIHARMPSASLVYLSQQLSADVVEEALRVGAHGYVHKSRTHQDLLVAIDVVLGGRRFVSCGLNVKAGAQGHQHDVQLYADESALLERTTEFLANALAAGNPAIVLATPAHRQRFIEGLRNHGIDINHEIQQGTYIDHDAAEVLSCIMLNQQPDVARFRECLGHLLALAARSVKTDRCRIAIFGECVALLAAAGYVQAAIQLERAWNGFLETRLEIELLCAYPLTSVGNGNRQTVLRDICVEHTTAYVT